MRTRSALLGGQTTALGLMMAFLVVPASALFLDAYGARILPWAYVVVGVIGIPTSALVSRAGSRTSLAVLAGGLVSAYLVVVAAGWLALVVTDTAWATFVLVVLFPLAIPVGFVAVGSQAVRLFDVRELKKHFPRVVAGFPVGFAVGGLVAGLVADSLGRVDHLLLLGVLCGLGMLAIVGRTAREFPAELLTRPEPRPVEDRGDGTRTWRAGTSVLRDPLVAAVLGYQVLSGAVTQLLDFIVWERAAALFPDPASLARFQGLYGSALNVASILFVGLVASVLLRAYGIRLGLAANPALVLLACVVLLVVGEGWGIMAVAFLGTACLAQVADITTTDGLTRGSVAATYQAMPPERRLSAQTLAEGAGTPVAIGLVGVLLLLAQAVDLGVMAVVWLVLGLSALWLGLALVTYRSYGTHLAEVLRHRSWDPSMLRIHGDAATSMVRRLRSSEQPSDRMTSLEAHADSDSAELDAELQQAMADPDLAVRLRALELVAGQTLTGRPLARAGLRALVGPTPDGVRAAAILVAHDPEAEPTAGLTWSDAVAGGDPLLAEAAVAGAAMAPEPTHLDRLLVVAGEPNPPLGILEALAAHADLLGPTLESLWWSAPKARSEPGRRRAAVVRAVAGAGRTEARRWLLARLANPDLRRTDLRLVLGGLAPSSWTPQPATVPASVLAGVLEAEAGRVLSALVGLDHVHRAGSHLVDHWDPGSGFGVAASAFRDEVDEASQHVATLFGATACPRGTAWFVSALGGSESQLRAAAIELTEATLGRRRGAITVAVLDPTLSDCARIAALGAAGVRGVESADDPERWLAEVCTDTDRSWDSPWLQASVLRCLPALSPERAERAAQTLVDHADPVVAQTAAWVLAQYGSAVSELGATAS